jgi:ADP-ribose pyrophosphatase
MTHKKDKYHMQAWKTVSRQVILSQPPFLVVENHIVELPDGRIIPEWSWVITPDYINVVVVTEEGLFLCFRQTKYAIDGTSLAPVGGYLEPGEEPLTAAQRELLEETGYTAPDWIDLGSYAVDGNRGAGNGHLFLARNARRVAEISADDLEEQELLSLSRDQVVEAIVLGEFKVISWAAAMALALLHTKG